MALKTDFSDGDIFYAGTTSDNDKLNGITYEINNKIVPFQVYEGTDLNFDVDNDGSTQENSYELNTITNINSKILLKINAYCYGSSGNNVNGYGRISLKIEKKAHLTGSYSTLYGYNYIFYAGGDDSDYGGSQIHFEYYYTPSSTEISEGLDLKIWIKGVNHGTSSHVTFTNNQIITIKI